MKNKIVRSICYFSQDIDPQIETKLNDIQQVLEKNGFWVQTHRACFPKTIAETEASTINLDYLSVGSVTFDQATQELATFKNSPKNLSFNIDLTDQNIEEKHTTILFDLIKNNPEKTFLFTYVFNNQPSSPYFPSADYQQDGFSIGLQPIDLSLDCNSIEEWLSQMQKVWQELIQLFANHQDFLGIDSSTAPLLGTAGSLVNFLNRIGRSLTQSATSNDFMKITTFLKQNNPKPVGLCGLMLPCLEDSYLAAEYEKGNFTIERNVFLSLHSGLGIDTYPIGIDEEPQRVVEILQLVQGLSNKYQKPLSARFVSDGKTKIGQKSDFQNQYLQDVVIAKL